MKIKGNKKLSVVLILLGAILLSHSFYRLGREHGARDKFRLIKQAADKCNKCGGVLIVEPGHLKDKMITLTCGRFEISFDDNYDIK